MPAAWPFSIPKENFYENRKKENLPEAGEKALQCGISSYDVSRALFPDIIQLHSHGGNSHGFSGLRPGKGLFGSDFVGLKHFIYMIHLPDIGKIIRNTLVIALGKILLGTVMAIAFSILLNEIRIKFLKKTVQTVVTRPFSFPGWSASVVVNLFSLDGSVNQLLAGFGMDKINFLGSNQTFQGLIIGTDVWKEFGYSSVVYLAAITSIDPGLHEAGGPSTAPPGGNVYGM